LRIDGGGGGGAAADVLLSREREKRSQLATRESSEMIIEEGCMLT